MASHAYAENVTSCRVAFAGCSGAGKATALQALKNKFTARPQGKVTWVHSPPLGAMWLEFLASKTPGGHELWVDVHGVTGVPPAPLNEEHGKWLLDGADGVVFFVDSTRARLEDNRLAFASFRQLMAQCRRPPQKTVLLYNKRDLPAAELASLDELGAIIDPTRELEFAQGAAREDLGCVIGAMKAVLKPALAQLHTPR
jgi:hypothetical protein